MQSLWTSLTALQSSMNWLNRIGNNVANENTPGYAEQTGSFADTLTKAVESQATAPAEAGRYTPLGWNAGAGVQTTGVENSFTQMPLQQTGVPTDLAIQGSAFFAVKTADGQIEYTKAGNFVWSKQIGGGEALTTPDGKLVLGINGQPITKSGSPGAKMTVSPNGQISFGAQKGPTIALYQASNPNQTMHLAGANAYRAQANAGIHLINGPTATATGGANSSTVVQGALSMSNVDLTKEMTSMMQAQRMFELNSQAVSYTDKMMQTADSIRP